MLRAAAPLAVVLIALARAIFFAPPPFVEWHHDDVYFVSLAEARRDPALFQTDVLFQRFRAAFPSPYIALLGGAISALGSMEAAVRWVPAALLVVYLLGVYALTARMTGSRAAGVAAALVASRPWPTPFLVRMGIMPGRIFPRDVTTALLPWLLLLVVREPVPKRRGPSIAAGAAYLTAGLLASIHPISAPHVFALLLAAALASRDAAARPREAIAACGLAALGALPYAISLARLPGASLPSLEAIRFRMPYALPPPAADVASFLLVQALPLGVLGGIGIAAGRFARPRSRIALVAILVVAAGVALLGAATAAIPVLRPLEPIRAAQYVFFPLVIGVGALAARGFAAGGLVRGGLASRGRSRRALALAAACLPVLVLAEPTWTIGPLGRFAGRLGIGGAPTNFLLQTDPDTMREVMAASSVDPGGGREAFLDLARFAREETTPRDVFLLPPVGLDNFRVHARRGAYVTWKDGGVILFSRPYAEEWERRFRRAVALYARPDSGAFGALLSTGEAQFAVCDARRPRLDLPVVFENARFVVYGAKARPDR
jgi:hypothetical protein